jgi:hypothetical protein
MKKFSIQLIRKNSHEVEFKEKPEFILAENMVKCIPEISTKLDKLPKDKKENVYRIIITEAK